MVQPNAPVEIYQLHILLLQINPPIWRRLHVRSDSSIATLHDLLQIAFDWSDFHLHRFVIRCKEYGVSPDGLPHVHTDPGITKRWRWKSRRSRSTKGVAKASDGSPEWFWCKLEGLGFWR